jgi:Uma2 family endonuclease
MGYEPFALNELVKIYKEDEIKTFGGDKPTIKFYADGKSRNHFTDIFIPHLNLIIEVKSTWTYSKAEEDYVHEKQAAAKEKGYRYEIWIYNQKGRKEEVIV